MRNFNFVNPTRIIFGQGTIKRLGMELSNDGIRGLCWSTGRALFFATGSMNR